MQSYIYSYIYISVCVCVCIVRPSHHYINDPKTRWPNLSLTKVVQSPFVIAWVLSASGGCRVTCHIIPIKIANSLNRSPLKKVFKN